MEATEEAVLLAEAPGAALVLGGGSNVVIADQGVPGTVLRVATEGVTFAAVGDEVEVTAAAGQDWDALVERTLHEGLCGLEALSGIPGRVGATPIQNVGAYGTDVASTIVAVRAFDRRTGKIEVLPPTACAFGYRHSAFKADPGRWLVLDVTYRLGRAAFGAPVRYAELARALGVEVGECAPAAQVREAVLGLRRGKGMVLDAADPDSRSVGSFFTNPVLDAAALAALHARVGEVPSWAERDGGTKVSAAWLIERAGFAKGWGPGPVGLSSKHVLALVHRGGGSTADLLAAARQIRTGVLAATGVALVPEPVLVGVHL